MNKISLVGTGHEMAFVMLLCALFKVGVFIDSDREAVGLRIFAKYISFV